MEGAEEKTTDDAKEARNWVSIDGAEEEGSGESVSVASYNMLAFAYARRRWFPNSSPRHLSASYRHRNLLREILFAAPDLLCLQEVDKWEEKYKDALEKKGYACEYKHRTGGRKDGCLIAYKTDRFKCVTRRGVNFNNIGNKLKRNCFKTQNVALMLELELVRDGTPGENEHQGEAKRADRFILVNAHLNWQSKDLRLLQTVKLLQDIFVFVNEVKNKCKIRKQELPLIICGDFNAPPDSDEYDMITNGVVNLSSLSQNVKKRMDLQSYPQSFAPLFSAYKSVLGREPAFTNYKLDFHNTLDYIFYSPEHRLKPVKVLDLPSEVTLFRLGMPPNKVFSSDHFMLYCEFRLLMMVEEKQTK